MKFDLSDAPCEIKNVGSGLGADSISGEIIRTGNMYVKLLLQPKRVKANVASSKLDNQKCNLRRENGASQVSEVTLIVQETAEVSTASPNPFSCLMVAMTVGTSPSIIK